MKKRTKLTIETERVLVIHSGAVKREAVCEACGEPVNFIRADEAAKLARVSARTVYRMVEAGEIHFTRANEELLLICFNSLCHSLLGADVDAVTQSLEWARRRSEGGKI